MKHKVTENIKLMDLLIKLYPDSPRTRIKKLLANGSVFLRGKCVSHFATELIAGDEIEIKTGEHRAEKPPMRIIFEDDHFVAIDKIPGINSKSSDSSPSCVEIMSDWFRDNTNGRTRVYAAHRLDKEVSGVLLLAKSEKMMDFMRNNWDKTEKKYLAIVEGTPNPPEGTVESWIIEGDDNRVKSLKKEVPGSKFAKSEYRTIKKIDKYTVLEVKLHTGRKNQIRAHMADIGCPIAGDRRYGADRKYERRIRLHSIYLSFPHPVTGKAVVIESKPPESFFVFKDKDEDYKN
ncbi:MAG TPA: RluA family pseudouridine synthase [bacterium]|nr:RluA family pseudouridine synthase [bacterium]